MPSTPIPARVCDNIATLFKNERERKGLSLSAVAERAGLSYQMIAFVERGERTPTMGSFIRIANALEVDPVKLLAEAVRE